MAKKGLDFKKLGTKAAGIVAGTIAGKFADKTLTNVLGNKSTPTINGLALVAVGAMLPTFVKGNDLVDSMADGVLAVGANKLAGVFVPSIAGIEGIEGIDGIGTYDEVSGYEDYVNGPESEEVIQGTGLDNIAAPGEQEY